MRIRKHAKTSAFLLHTNSNSNNNNNNNHQPTLCLLNQSPWDIITFPSTHSSSTSIHLVRFQSNNYQICSLNFATALNAAFATFILQFDDYVTHYDVNRSSAADSGRPIQRIGSTENSFDCDYDIADKNGNADDNIMNYESYEKEEEEKLGFESEDNCVDSQNDVVWSTSKKAQSVTKSRGYKKRAVAVTSKQNEFYYYSGFGPSWGKKRGGNKCTTFDACGTTIASADTGVSDMEMDVGMDMDVVKDEKWGEPDTTTMRTVWSCREGPGVDFFDDVEEEEKQKEKAVKKRGRKPIKERSLKSLM